MYLVINVVICISIFIIKNLITSNTEMYVVRDSKSGETSRINPRDIPIGDNLSLMKEPRAYHKILDELGLS